MNDVTRILSAVEHGDARAVEQLLPDRRTQDSEGGQAAHALE